MTPPAFIGSMSSGRLFLGELLSSRARLRFPGHAHAPTIHSRSSSKTQRTANRDFSLCLTPGVHPTVKPFQQELTRNSTRKPNKNKGLVTENNLPQSCLLVSPNPL
jgi:hypothetical protein